MSHDGISVFDGPNVDEPMVDARAAHNALLIPLRWINSKAARRARGVPHYRIGHLVRFRLGELEQWRDHHATVMVIAPEVVDAAVQPVSPLTMVEHFSDADWRSRDGLARIFWSRHGGDWRYHAGRRRWFSRTPEGWRRDDRLGVLYQVRCLCGEAAGRALTPAQRWLLGSYAFIQAVERLARRYASAVPMEGHVFPKADK